MKKILALLLALALCMALCACGQEKPAETPAATSSPEASIAKAKPTSAPETPSAPAASAEPVAPTEAPEKPEIPEKPEKTEKPEKAEKPTSSGVVVSDYCAIAGRMDEGGFFSHFSYILPSLSGADTPYIKEINETVEGIYDDYVQEALDCLADDLSLYSYCAAYYTGAKNGVNSLLITCDTDWGEEYYWCFNYDDDGNEVDNEAVLKAAGMTPKQFVSAARDYLKDYTDLSEYFEDDGWKELQEQTISDDNCNADMPMVLLPDGNLCFIATIYTPAGAGVYDHALEFVGKKEIQSAVLGETPRYRLSGTYFVEGPEDSDTDLFCEIYTVGDTVTMELTGFGKEEGGVFYYYAADIYPDDISDLYCGDLDSLDVRVLPYSVDVFDGSYYGEPGYYTLRFDGRNISFTDYDGGTPLIGEGEDFTLVYAYRDDYDLEDPVPDTDYDHFDFDAVEAAGLAGVWGGTYYDSSYKNHALTLQLTSWGQLRMRDQADGAIPRVLLGSYYIAGEEDDSGAPAGAVVFNAVTVGGYKMPVMGYLYMDIDEEGTLLLDIDPESWYMQLIDLDPDHYGVLHRVPHVSFLTTPETMKLDERESAYVDIMRDGQEEELSYYFTRDKSAGDAITALTVVLEGEEYTLDDMWAYDAEVYLIVPSMTGRVYLYIDELSDNDYHYTEVVAVEPDSVRYAGDFFGGFAAEPEDLEYMLLSVRTQILSTSDSISAFRIGLGGLPEQVEPWFYMLSDLTLTAKEDVDCWVVSPDTGELVDTAVLSAGEEVEMLRTDCRTFVDLLLENGDVRRVWVDAESSPQSIDGEDIEALFDGIRFAG